MTWVTVGSTAGITRTAGLARRRRARRRTRSAAVAAGLAAALALTACGDGDGSGPGDTGGGPPAGSGTSASTGAGAGTDAGGGAGASADAGADGSASAPAPGPLEGSWLATTGGSAVALVVTGRRAAVFATGGSMCSGTTGRQAGQEVIRLRCADGGKDRTYGVVDSVGGTTLKVTWEGGLGSETYTKAEGGKFPSGLPASRPGS